LVFEDSYFYISRGKGDEIRIAEIMKIKKPLLYKSGFLLK